MLIHLVQQPVRITLGSGVIWQNESSNYIDMNRIVFGLFWCLLLGVALGSNVEQALAKANRLADLGLVEESVSAYREAIKLDPTDPR
jgi:hypothetical protein